MGALIEASGISKVFATPTGSVTGLHDFSIKIAHGGLTALVGPSGSGKSTLLNLFGALDVATQGRLMIDGQSIETMSANQRSDFRNQSIGFVFQNFNLVPVLTALENVMLPAQLSHVSRPGALERAKELLKTVGLEEQMHQAANRLSGGQMQRVAIARALINQPKLILADEPTANLDHRTAEVILELLAKGSQQERVTVVIATHDPEVLKYCQRIIRLRDGVMIADELKPSQGHVA